MNDRKELEEYYENYLDLFTHPGWTQFVNQINDEIENHRNSVFNVSKEDFDVIKGQVSVLSRIVNLPLLVEQGYESLEDDAHEAF